MAYRETTYRIGNVRLTNPLVVASSPATEDPERLLRCAEAGAAGAVLKSCHTVGTPPRDLGARRFRDSLRGLWGTSTMARELMHPEDVHTLLMSVAGNSSFVVFPSVAGFTLDVAPWIETLRMLEKCGVAGVQLDFFYLREDISLHSTQQRLRTLLLELGGSCHLDLIPKLNIELRPGPALANIGDVGIAGWSVLDSVRTHLPSCCRLDDSTLPRFRFGSGLTSASLFGDWELPLVCEYIYRLRMGSTLPILGGGGVSNAADMELLLSLGASAVQVATPVIREGPEWIRRTLAELGSNARREEDYRPEPIAFYDAVAGIDPSKCIGCRRCANQMMCNAITMQLSGPYVDSFRCDGCGFCVDLCPEGAISLRSVGRELDQPFRNSQTGGRP